MGLIKLALITGVAVWGYKKVTSNGENQCMRRRNMNPQDPSTWNNNTNLPPQYDSKRQYYYQQQQHHNHHHEDHEHQRELFPTTGTAEQQTPAQNQYYYPSNPSINNNIPPMNEKSTRMTPIAITDGSHNNTPNSVRSNSPVMVNAPAYYPGTTTTTTTMTPKDKVNDMVDRAVAYLESGKVSEAKDLLMGKMGFKN